MTGWLAGYLAWVEAIEQIEGEQNVIVQVTTPTGTLSVEALLEQLLGDVANLEKYPRLLRWIEENASYYQFDPIAMFRDV